MDASCLTYPSSIRTCGFPAYGFPEIFRLKHSLGTHGIAWFFGIVFSVASDHILNMHPQNADI